MRDKSVNYTLISYWNLLWEFINNLIKMFTSVYKTYIIFIKNKTKEVIAMNMNTLYIMLGFIFVYAMISNVRDKIKKRDEKSKEAFERLQTPAYKKELEKVINLSQDDAFNIAALRKAYFLNGKDAKKLIEIFKKDR